MAAHNEAAQVAQVEATAAQAIADAARTSAAVVDAAAADVAAAQETAQQLAAAAIAAPLAIQVAQLEEDTASWEHEQERHHANHAERLSSLESQMTGLLSRLTALENPKTPQAIVIAPLAPVDQSSTLQVPNDLMQEAVIIQPETLTLPPANGDTNDALPKRRTRFL